MKNGNAQNRRHFLKAGIMSAAGAVIASKTTIAATNSTTGLSSDKKIVYRTLGKTGIKLPVVSMGVMRADNPALVKAALEKGVLHLDTAHGYQEGRNETMLGKLLKDYPRDSYIISTKIPVNGIDRKTGTFTEDFDDKSFMEKLDTSLERLQTDHVDFLYLHGMSSREALMHEPVKRCLRKIKKQGKARFVGVSTHRNMAEVLDAAADSKFYDVVLSSYNFQHNDSAELHAALEKAGKAGVGIIAMKTMAGGFFDKERTQRVNTKAALKWALMNENITTAIPGYTSFDQLDESFSVMEDLSLTGNEWKDLKIEDPSASLFCTGCEECIPACKKGLPVSDLVRAYMYTYGYRESAKAREVVMASGLANASPCDDCDECTVTCSRGFNVAERINDVARLRDVPGEFLA
ncbi:MAG TPA: aldo/keto reductase [Bacteroidales bacterium]|nr:aldo/keto reductase [Bacteroidales bacterium]